MSASKLMRKCAILATLALLGVLPICALALPILKPKPMPPPTAATPSQVSLSKGYAALMHSDLKAASAAFEEAAKLDEKSALPQIGLAEVARRQNQPYQVELWLKKALEIDPKSPEALRAWARYQIGLNRFAEAGATLQQAISFAPSSADAYVDLGDNYLGGLHKPGEAANAYREAIKLKPNLAAAHLGLGAALAAQGEVAPAVVEFGLAAKFAPKDPVPSHELGRLYASQKQYDKALAAMDKALKIQPGYMPARLDRGDIFVAKGALDKALVEYQAAAKALPKLAIAHLKVGAVFQAQKKWTEAEQAFLKAVEADPKMFGAYNNLAWMAVERKEHLQEALVWANKAVEIAPESGDCLDTLGWVHHARGELDPAIVMLEKAVTKPSPRADFYYHLGVVYAEKGRRPEAVAALKKALEIDKKFAQAEDAHRQLEKLSEK